MRESNSQPLAPQPENLSHGAIHQLFLSLSLPHSAAVSRLPCHRLYPLYRTVFPGLLHLLSEVSGQNFPLETFSSWGENLVLSPRHTPVLLAFNNFLAGQNGGCFCLGPSACDCSPPPPHNLPTSYFAPIFESFPEMKGTGGLLSEPPPLFYHHNHQ